MWLKKIEILPFFHVIVIFSWIFPPTFFKMSDKIGNRKSLIRVFFFFLNFIYQLGMEIRLY